MIRELPVTEFDLSQAVTIWDVRDAKSFAEGHLKGAVNRPIEDLSAEVLAAVPAGEPVYVLCGGGTKAPRAAVLLDGFDPSREVVVLTGGTRKAKAEGLPIETGWQKTWKEIGLIFVILGVLQFLGMASGARDWTRPLENLGVGATANAVSGGDRAGELVFGESDSNEALDRAIASAKAAGKPVLFDFYADWCIERQRVGRDEGVQVAQGCAAAPQLGSQIAVTRRDRRIPGQHVHAQQEAGDSGTQGGGIRLASQAVEELALGDGRDAELCHRHLAQPRLEGGRGAADDVAGDVRIEQQIRHCEAASPNGSREACSPWLRSTSVMKSAGTAAV